MRANRVPPLNLLHVKPIHCDHLQLQLQVPFSDSNTERRRVQERRRQVGQLFQKMSNFLSHVLDGDMKMTTLLNLAQSIAEKQGLHIDRPARRAKDGLICWFCEFMPIVTSSIKELTAANASKSAEKPKAEKVDPFESLLTAFEEQELQNEDWFRQTSDW